MYFVEVLDRETGKIVVRFREDDDDTTFGIYFMCCHEAQPWNRVYLTECLPANESSELVNKLLSFYMPEGK